MLVTWTDIDDEQNCKKHEGCPSLKKFEDERIFEEGSTWKCTKSHIEHFSTWSIPITWTNFNYERFPPWTFLFILFIKDGEKRGDV